jgi:hypothetical protein
MLLFGAIAIVLLAHCKLLLISTLLIVLGVGGTMSDIQKFVAWVVQIVCRFMCLSCEETGCYVRGICEVNYMELPPLFCWN